MYKCVKFGLLHSLELTGWLVPQYKHWLSLNSYLQITTHKIGFEDLLSLTTTVKIEYEIEPVLKVPVVISYVPDRPIRSKFCALSYVLIYN